MNPYYEHGGITIYHGDCLEVMDDLRRQSVDLVLTDPFLVCQRSTTKAECNINGHGPILQFYQRFGQS